MKCKNYGEKIINRFTVLYRGDSLLNGRELKADLLKKHHPSQDRVR